MPADGSADEAAINVLIVDDDASLRQALAMSLRSVAGLLVRQASTSEEALHLAACDPPDIVLMDIRLGSESGYNVVHSMRSQLPGHEMDFWMVTGNCGTIDEHFAAQLNVRGTLTKPFERKRLREVVEMTRVRCVRG